MTLPTPTVNGETDCCKKYKKKGKACGACPLLAAMEKRERKKLLRKYRRRHARRKAA